MRYALVNPRWSFAGSTYFGCRDAHLPLELLFAAADLRRRGHEALLIDALMEELTLEQAEARLRDWNADFVVIPTAPSYLFWRCPQPELRLPAEWARALRGTARTVLIGPHASATPGATLRKTGCDIALRGEPDQILARLAKEDFAAIPGCCWRDAEGLHLSAELAATDMRALPRLDFADYPVRRHAHKHHVFGGVPGLGAELEFARGCPWSCTFCNKTLFRNKFRERAVEDVVAEIDTLIAQGVEYIYFIDEIFGVGRNARLLLRHIADRPVAIGLQTRIDLWDEAGLDLLGAARCISMECGIESITPEGRDEMNKNCRLSTERIAELLIYARGRVPWVQANLIRTPHDDDKSIRAWQAALKGRGVWVSEPVPMFPFPGSPLYLDTFGAPPDDAAWERAHRHYLDQFGERDFSDIQERRPLPLEELECTFS